MLIIGFPLKKLQEDMEVDTHQEVVEADIKLSAVDTKLQKDNMLIHNYCTKLKKFCSNKNNRVETEDMEEASEVDMDMESHNHMEHHHHLMEFLHLLMAFPHTVVVVLLVLNSDMFVKVSKSLNS